MKFNFFNKRIACHFVYSFILFLFFPLFSMRDFNVHDIGNDNSIILPYAPVAIDSDNLDNCEIYESSGIGVGEFDSKFLDLVETLPREVQRDFHKFIENKLHYSDNIIRIGDRKISYGYSISKDGELDFFWGLKNPEGFYYKDDVFHRKFNPDDLSSSEIVCHVVNNDDDDDERKYPINDFNIPEKKEKPYVFTSNDISQIGVDGVRSMGSNKFTSLDIAYKNALLKNVESAWDGIKWIDLSDLNEANIDKVISVIDELLIVVQSGQPVGNLVPRKAIRNEFDVVQAFDGTEFYNEQYYKKKVKWVPVVNWVAGKIGSHKDKWALRDALKYNRQLLDNKKSEINSKKIQENLETINNKINEIISDGLKEDFGADATLNDLVNTLADNDPSFKDDFNNFNSNKSSSYSASKPQGFLENVATKMLQFGKESAIKNPKLTKAVTSVVSGGVQGVLSDPTIVPMIKNTIIETKNSLKPKDLVAEFDRRNFGKAREVSFAPNSNTTSVSDIPFKMETRNVEEIKFKNHVERKITYQKIELDDFAENYISSNISKNDNPLIYYSNEYVKETYDIALLGLDLSSECYTTNMFEYANSLADMSSSLVKAGKLTYEFVKAFGGASKDNAVKCGNPYNVFKEYGESLVDLVSLFTKSTIKLVQLSCLAQVDPQQAGERLDAIFKRIGNGITLAKESYSALSSEEKACFWGKNLGNIISEIAIPGAAGKVGKKFLKAVPALIEKGSTLGRAVKKGVEVGGQKIKGVLSPLEYLAKEGAGCLQIAGIEGHKVSLSALKIASREKNIIKAEGSLSRSFSRTINKTNKKLKTVWNNIKVTDKMYPSSKIPRSFELTVKSEKIWIHPNATKHMYQYLIKHKAITHNTPLNSQILLSDFKLAVEKAVANGFKYDNIFNIGSWEFMIGKPRAKGLLPTIYHANYFPKKGI
ncbi:MAG: hypothetical protein ABIF12_00175 [bacterium]